MMKNVNFNAIVFKFAIPLLLLRLLENLPWLRDEELGKIGWISCALLLLLIPVCCFFGVRKEPETEETRKVSEFLFRLFGLYQTILALGSFPWIIQFLLVLRLRKSYGRRRSRPNRRGMSSICCSPSRC